MNFHLESLTDTDKAAFEQLYQEAIHFKTKAGMAKKAKQGILHGCAPLGYKNAVVNGKKVIVIDPETAYQVRELFRLSEEKGMTYRKLAAVATDMGFTSRNGRSFGPSAIFAILKNPFYRGMVRCKGRLIQGSHEPLIT